MAFNYREYDWVDVTFLLGGQDLTGIRAIKYTSKTDKEPVFAKGRKPHFIASGNYTFEGEVELLQSDVEALIQASPNKDLLAASFDALCNYGTPPSAITTDRLVGIQFSEVPKEIKQGDKFMTIKLPFMMLDVEPQV